MLSYEQFCQIIKQEIKDASKWIESICNGYKEIIVCTGSPFCWDVYYCFWIKKLLNEKLEIKVYDADWILFDLDNLPKRIISIEGNKVDPFQYVEKRFNEEGFYTHSNISQAMMETFKWFSDKDTYDEEHREERLAEGKPTYEENSYSRVQTNGSWINDEKHEHGGYYKYEYNGDMILNLYIIARR